MKNFEAQELARVKEDLSDLWEIRHWENEDVEFLELREPGSSMYCHYFTVLKRRGMLLVAGDCGAAAYAFWRDTSLAELAKTDLHYFHGKNVSSESGAGFHQWSREYAEERVRQMIEEHIAENAAESVEDCTREVAEAEPLLVRVLRELPLSDQYEWRNFVGAEMKRWKSLTRCDSADDLADWLSGAEAEGPFDFDSWDYELGLTIHVRCLCHHAALQRAMTLEWRDFHAEWCRGLGEASK